MTAALASHDPLMVGTSGRIVTHTLMSSGHLPAAVTTAQDHAALRAAENRPSRGRGPARRHAEQFATRIGASKCPPATGS